MSPPDLDALATEVVLLMKTALAPIQARLAVLEAKPAAPVAPVAPEIAPEDMAASIAGLLRKELADLEPTVHTQTRVVRDGHGAVKFAIEDVTS